MLFHLKLIWTFIHFPILNLSLYRLSKYPNLQHCTDNICLELRFTIFGCLYKLQIMLKNKTNSRFEVDPSIHSCSFAFNSKFMYSFRIILACV